MRKKKHGDERREALSYLLIPKGALVPGSAASFFDDAGKPVRLEIGCGKGDFIIGTAKQHPEYNYIAMERVPDVILCAMEKCAQEGLSNVRFYIGNAANLEEYIGENEIDALYLNFSDPWPKAGHEKRRLTYQSFLFLYQRILKKGAPLAFKTDNRGLFDYSLESFAQNGWRCTDITYDLHASPWNETNVVTEYERNFSAKGFSINRVVAYPPDTPPAASDEDASAEV